jgi:hypothetical protein
MMMPERGDLLAVEAVAQEMYEIDVERRAYHLSWTEISRWRRDEYLTTARRVLKALEGVADE